MTNIGEQFTADFDKPADLGFDLVEQRALKQQVVDRVGGQPEFRKYHEADARFVAVRQHRLDRGAVMPGIGNRHVRHADGEANKLVGVGRKKRRHCGRCSRRDYLLTRKHRT